MIMKRNSDIRENRVTDQPRTADANRDPITGAPGAHPVGTGVGAAGGGAAGAAIGAAAGGPVGAAVGLAVGAIAGGLAGKGAGEAVNPTVESAYWRENYNSQPWYERNYTYEDYEPAFRTGYEGYSRYYGQGRSYDQVEPELRRDWDKYRGSSRLDWERARPASQAAWRRVDQAGGTDNTGR
jgi:hypothetical protein